MEEKFLQSGEVLLEIAKSEYQNEFSRSSVLDTKIGIALPIIATYFFLILQYKNFKQLFLVALDFTNVLTVIGCVFGPIIFVAAITSAAIALIYLFRAIVTHSYQKIEPSYFNTKDKMSMPPCVFSGVMVTYYIKASKYNRATNDKRVALYKRGWTLAMISLGLFVVYSFLG